MTARQRDRQRIALTTAGLVTVVMLVVGGLGLLAAVPLWRLTHHAVDLAVNPAARQADQAATEAGYRMLPNHRQIPATQAAAGITQAPLGADQVEVLVATGTTWDGQIVLRISTSQDNGDFSPDRATRCYRYDLTYDGRGPESPHQIDCPDTTPLELAPLPPPAMLPATVDTTMRRVLAMPTGGQPQDPVVVWARLTSAFSSQAVTVDTTRLDDGTVGVAVFATANPESCLGARLPVDGPPQLVYPARVAVQPGELGCQARFFAIPHAYDPPH